MLSWKKRKRGILMPGLFPENARPIGADVLTVSPVLIRRFTCQKIKAASLLVTGLGYFEAAVNGAKVGNERFLPVPTDYLPRAFTRITYPCRDHFTHRICAYRFDVTSLLRSGENELTIRLGNGWYRQTERTAEGEMSYGDRLWAIYSLTLDTGDGETTLVSDGSEVWRESGIRYSNLFVGETVDARFSDETDKPVTLLPLPDSEFSPAMGTPDREIGTVRPFCYQEDGAKKYFDCGRNLSGIVRVKTSGHAGEVVTLRFAEERFPDGTLDFGSTGAGCTMTSGRKQIMTDRFILDGTKRVFEPSFVWHTFRYFEVEGPFDALEAVEIHSDAEKTASFASDAEGMDFLFDAFTRTQLAAMHGSFPCDCPHRERLGYTGDGQVCAEAGMLFFDSKEFYRKWIRDILDCQDPESGHIQHTAPFQGGGGGPGGWGCAVILVPYQFWKRFGDTTILTECYEPMKKWLGYLDAHSENGLVTSEEPGGWCLGDWCTLEKMRLPEPFVNSFYHARCLGFMEEIAQALGKTEDIPSFAAKRETVLSAVRRTFRDPVTGHYCDGTQGADAYAASLGLDLTETVRLTAEYYDSLGHFDTGFLGTDILLEVLFREDRADTAYRLLQSEDMGSFLYMKRHGATTLWENWHPGSSHCHPMFGGCSRHLFGGLLGFHQPKHTAGWKTVEIAPKLPAALNRASGSLALEGGTLALSFERSGDAVRFELTIPEGVNGTFRFGKTELALTAGRMTVTVKG